MDEEQVQDAALNEDVQVSDVTESPAVEATEAPAEAPEQPTQEEVREEPKPRNNAQSRIRELAAKAKQAEAERDQYAELLQQANQMPVPEDVSEDEYRALQVNAQYAATEVQQLKRQLAYKDFVNEVDVIEQQHPELNPDSDKYNEKLANALSKAFDDGFIVRDQRGEFVGTKKSLKEFTSEMLEAYRDAETRGAAKTSEALSRQAAEAAVTPQSSATSEPKATADKSIKELEKELGVVHL